MKYLIFLGLMMCGPISGKCQMQFINAAGKTLDPQDLPKGENRNILLYTSTTELPRKAHQIGILLATIPDKTEAILKAKEYAARAGGDAILMYPLKTIGIDDVPPGMPLRLTNYAFYVYKIKKVGW